MTSNGKLGRHRKGVVPMSVYNNSAVKRIIAKYSGTCRICGKGYQKDTRVVFDRLQAPGRKVAHVGCHRDETTKFAKT